jgi:uncharacterized lipoprotein YddW (UPF0748 family)
MITGVAMLALATRGQAMLPPLPPIPREFRGVWVATVDNIDWPSKRTLSTAAEQAELIKLLDKAQAMHLNAIVFQVRPSADALYPSKLEPWSEFLTGKQGQVPSPSWDPIAFAVREAHKRGLELHCWFNPYRALHPAQKGPVAANHISKTNPGVVKKYGPFLWMDPGEAVVQRRTEEVILDVVRRYDVDGVHIDDYFYPYREKDPKTKEFIDFPDGASWSRYKGGLSRGDWRRKNVDDFIEHMYVAIKREKRWVKFGISPFGIYRPGMPAGIKAGVDQYADLYADALRWYSKGWCDYFAPQLYWPIAQTPQAYEALLQWWAVNNDSHRHLWAGNYTSRLFDGSPPWAASEVVDQIRLTREMPGASGNIHFSMKAFLLDSGGIDEALADGIYDKPAFVPASPWLADGRPPAPKLASSKGGRVVWTSSATAFGVSVCRGGRWSDWKPTDDPELSVDTDGLDGVAVVAFDRAQQQSAPLIVRKWR